MKKYFDGGNWLDVEKYYNVKLYYLNEKRHRIDGPAFIKYDTNGNIQIEKYYINGKKHRIDGPAFIKYHDLKDYSLKKILFKIFYNEKILKEIEYWNNGKKHRLDGPAFLCYYKNGNIQTEMHFSYSILHREDGPAIVDYNTNQSIFNDYFYINGNKISKKQLKSIGINSENYPFSKSDMMKIKLKFG